MTKVGTHTPISDDEAEAWVRRMASDLEDIEQLRNTDAWDEFVSSKIQAERGYLATDLQLARLGGTRVTIQSKLGFRTEYPFPRAPAVAFHRDIKTGRRISFANVRMRVDMWQEGLLK